MSVAIEYQPLKTIRLYGVLGATFGRVHRLAVESRQEAIKALSVIIPGFEKFLLTSKSRGLTYAVFDGKRNLSKDELDFNISSEIRIAPIIIGSKQTGLFQVILGAILVVAGYFTFGTTSTIGVSMMMGGASMALGGVIQMLTPMQGGLSMRESPDNKPSYAFGGPVNSIAQGNPVPILYGRRRIGGAIISAGIYAEDQQ
ncbi:tail assembly protein [Pectobacterium wasabiae]|uniref:Phage tail assembly protein n=1 Tax=Pectobacterium wasabiae TaxID=55208 RepID=A0AAW3EP84_9GAMM|nr:tail assembly protein [Pectobacterium wasabiae]AOR64872.1 phage tail protein [Pectobacterium wasabiae CFBP 3304]EJS96295.1 Putative phage tail protein, bacteriophage lambda tail assembly I-like protein [Pectobacterium wasabiae CFBP 3304]KFX09861.1 phage tail assembly protein [Pectobacterium wasabiae]KGA30063.1 phage tail assembly protein [Pectobacterium wasabiae]